MDQQTDEMQSIVTTCTVRVLACFEFFTQIIFKSLF